MNRMALLFAAMLALAGCSSIRSSGIATGPQRYAPSGGSVAVYASGRIPAESLEVGQVTVSGAGNDAAVDRLFPEFVRKAAALGGTAVVLDSIETSFENVPQLGYSSYGYRCGFSRMCLSSQPYTYVSQVAHMTLVGRALRVPEPGQGTPQ